DELAKRAEAKRGPRGRRLKDPKRADGEYEARHGVVALRHTLLDQVAHDDEEDQVDRLERAELLPAGDARQEDDERKGERCAEDDVHGLGEDGQLAVDAEDRLAVVRELGDLAAAADRGRVHLVLDVERVDVAGRDVPELEDEAAVAAP